MGLGGSSGREEAAAAAAAAAASKGLHFVRFCPWAARRSDGRTDRQKEEREQNYQRRTKTSRGEREKIGGEYKYYLTYSYSCCTQECRFMEKKLREISRFFVAPRRFAPAVRARPHKYLHLSRLEACWTRGRGKGGREKGRKGAWKAKGDRQADDTDTAFKKICKKALGPRRYHKGTQTGTAATLHLLPVGRGGPHQPGQLLVVLFNTL